jgi:hypothetical protein
MDWIDLTQDRDQVAGFYGQGNELTDCMKCWVIL